MKRQKLFKYDQFSEHEKCYHQDDWLESFSSLPKFSNYIMELGAGSCWFSLELAKRHKNSLIIALDRKRDRLLQGAKLATEQKLDNIVFLNAKIEVLGEIMPKNIISDIWLTFPDPYFKSRQAKHRMTNPSFLKIYDELLIKDGFLHLKTDNQMLLASAYESSLIGGYDCLELDTDQPTQGDGDSCIQTRYESLWRSYDLPISYIKFAKSI